MEFLVEQGVDFYPLKPLPQQVMETKFNFFSSALDTGPSLLVPESENTYAQRIIHEAYK